MVYFGYCFCYLMNMKGMKLDYLNSYMKSVVSVAESLDLTKVEQTVAILARLRNESGRVFVLGMGGSASNASHMVNDLRKICGVDAYSPIDNISEFSASCNDEGLGSYFPRWLETSKISNNDAIFVLSVGGGNREENVSMELVNAIEVARTNGSRILGIVGRDGGDALKNSSDVILVPTIISSLDTPLVESFQAVIWHAIVFHPILKLRPSKWESIVQ
jgi:D-sedoheptulose 7-phosphate isomerase